MQTKTQHISPLCQGITPWCYSLAGLAFISSFLSIEQKHFTLQDYGQGRLRSLPHWRRKKWGVGEGTLYVTSKRKNRRKKKTTEEIKQMKTLMKATGCTEDGQSRCMNSIIDFSVFECISFSLSLVCIHRNALLFSFTLQLWNRKIISLVCTSFTRIFLQSKRYQCMWHVCACVPWIWMGAQSVVEIAKSDGESAFTITAGLFSPHWMNDRMNEWPNKEWTKLMN